MSCPYDPKNKRSEVSCELYKKSVVCDSEIECMFCGVYKKLSGVV